MKLIQIKDYLLLIDEEAEIQKGGYAYQINYEKTNIQVIKIESDFQEKIANDKNGTFTKYKIIAYYPLTKEAKELDLPLLPPFEKVDVNVQTRNFNKQVKNPFLVEEKEYQVWEEAYIKGFDDGIAQSKQFSLEDMKKAMINILSFTVNNALNVNNNDLGYSYIEKYIQSLSTQQLPKEFILSDKFSTFEENLKNGEYKW